jgi:hypothetical protein
VRDGTARQVGDIDDEAIRKVLDTCSKLGRCDAKTGWFAAHDWQVPGCRG